MIQINKNLINFNLISYFKFINLVLLWNKVIEQNERNERRKKYKSKEISSFFLIKTKTTTEAV